MRGTTARQLLGIGLGTAVVPLDFAVNIAFPAITTGFGIAIADIQWVVICYVLTYASLMLAFGRIGDMFGHAPIFRVGLIWSAVACLLCALAPNFAALLLCRFLQGIGAALVLSCGIALMTGVYGEARRSRALGVYAMVFGVGATIGPLLGGALVQLWGWPAVFWFRTPVALAAVLLLPRVPRRAPRGDSGERFDALGAFLLVLAMVALLLALSRIRDAIALPLGIVAAAALVAFVRHERRVAHPILDLRVFRLPGFVVVNLANVVTNFAGFSLWLLVPYYLARQTELALWQGGLVLAAASLGTALTSPLGGRVIGRIAAESVALCGALAVALGLGLVARWGPHEGVPGILAALVLASVGLGLFQVAYADIVAASIPIRNRGVAGSLALVTRTVGNVGAAAVIVLLFQAWQDEIGFLAAFKRSFAVAAVLPLAMAGLMAWRPLRNGGRWR